MNLVRYTVRYDARGHIVAVHFIAPKGATNGNIMLAASGILFLLDYCPGEDFCVYLNGDRNHPTFPEEGDISHYCYIDSDRLWDPNITLVERTFGE